MIRLLPTILLNFLTVMLLYYLLCSTALVGGKFVLLLYNSWHQHDERCTLPSAGTAVSNRIGIGTAGWLPFSSFFHILVLQLRPIVQNHLPVTHTYTTPSSHLHRQMLDCICQECPQQLFLKVSPIFQLFVFVLLYFVVATSHHIISHHTTSHHISSHPTHATLPVYLQGMRQC